jgi:autotransporter-associated beta strand protein
MGSGNDKRARFALSAAVAATVMAMGSSGNSARADQYWDANDVTAGAGSAAPTGTWGIDAFWSPDANGEATTGAWTPGETAVFSAGTDATGAFTVTIDQTQSAAGVRFDEGDVTLSSGQLDLTGAATVQVDAATATISSVLGGTAGLVKSGTGILTLGGAGANTNGGLHDVTAGTLRLGAADRIIDTAALTVASGATFDLNNFGETVAALNGAGNITLGSATLTASGTGTFSGVISGSGGLTKTVANTLTLSGANTYSGLTSINGGTLSVSDTNNLGDGSATNNISFNAGTLATTTGITTARNIALAGVGTVNVSSGQTTTLNGVVSGGSSFVKSGAGTLILNGANAQTSTTQVTNGTVVVNNATALGTTGNSTSVSNGATVEIASGLTIAEAFNTINGQGVGGGGAIRKTGTGDSTISGTITTAASSNGRINSDGGTLNLTAAIFMGATGASVTYGGAGNIRVTANAAAAGPGNTSKLFKDGTGTLTLAANSSYGGGTVITGGTLSYDADGRLGGTPAAATPDHLIINGGTLKSTTPLVSDGVSVNTSYSVVGTNRGIGIGTTGQIDVTPVTPNSIVAIYSGIINKLGTLGPTDDAQLIKSGPNEFRYNGNNRASTTFTKLKVIEGLFRLGSVTGANTELGFGAAPAAPLADAITLDGGAIGTSFTAALHVNRGVTVGANGGVFNVTGAGLTVPGVITGSGVVNVIGGGGAVFSGANTYTGDTFIGSNNVTMFGGISPTTTGVLSISSDANLGLAPTLPDPGNVNIGTATATGTLIVTESTTIDSNRGVNIGAAGGTINVSGGKTATYGGVITGSGNLTKTTSGAGSGTLVLSGNNTYTGTTTSFGGGVLSISSDANLGAVPGAPVANKITLAGASTGGTLQATATTTLNVNRGVTLNNGGVDGPTGVGGTIDVTDANTLTVDGIVAGTGRLTKLGTGTLVLNNANTFASGTTVSAGTLVLGNADANAGKSIAIADGAVAQAQAGLPKAVTITTWNSNASGKLDITNNSMVVKGLTVPQVQAEIVKAFNAGQWNGNGGLTSSTAATALPAITAIGFASNGVLNKSEFKGVSGLTGTDVLVKYTYYGDSDLNGATTLDDYTLFLNGYQTAGNTWVQGDYDYNGLVTLDDFTLFLAGYQQQGVPLSELESLISSTPMSSADRSAMLAAVQAVPEPTGLALLGLGGAGLLARRRRK